MPFADTVPHYIIDGIAGSITASPGSGGIGLNLSNATATDASSVGTVVGSFSVTGGSTRTYTFSLTSNPGALFAISGANLTVNAALSAGSDAITARASDTGVSVVTAPFLITVTTASGGFVPTFYILGF